LILRFAHGSRQSRQPNGQPNMAEKQTVAQGLLLMGHISQAGMHDTTTQLLDSILKVMLRPVVAPAH